MRYAPDHDWGAEGLGFEIIVRTFAAMNNLKNDG
jgi:hypothetical protein